MSTGIDFRLYLTLITLCLKLLMFKYAMNQYFGCLFLIVSNPSVCSISLSSLDDEVDEKKESLNTGNWQLNQYQFSSVWPYGWRLARILGVSINHISRTAIRHGSFSRTFHKRYMDIYNLFALKEVKYNGWLDNVKELPSNLRAYWSFRDELAVEAGVIFKGRQILVPPSIQKDILKQLHSVHQGVEKTRRLARESIYWLKINSDIENTCKSCESCQEQQDANRHEPLLLHCLPARPWQHIATDLFQIHDRHYLLTVDRL